MMLNVLNLCCLPERRGLKQKRTLWGAGSKENVVGRCWPARYSTTDDWDNTINMWIITEYFVILLSSEDS